jgi:L-alanine-DL-glutamate epimerase-like enolase superfamily enzyme
VAAGFHTVKLKVGASGSLREDVERVARVRAAIGPTMSLRLDANEAWTPKGAIATIRACEQYRLEWVEQPVAAEDIAGLAAVRRAVGTRIAADESVTGPDAVRALLAAEAADVLILKPTLAGGPVATLRLAELARAAKVDSIVTTALETGIGVTAAAHSAAVLGPGLPACGLATTALLQDDLLAQPLRVEHGRLLMPTGIGLGVSLDREKLRHYTIGLGEATASR